MIKVAVVRQSEVISPLKDTLETVFLNGQVTHNQSLSEIRKLAEV